MTEIDNTVVPELSMILPVRNEGINLRVMLKILTSGVALPHELLVVYDKPDDDSVPVVQQLQQKYPNLSLVYNELGPGVPNAIRAGVQASRADVVLIICADDVGPVIAVDEMFALMREGCDFVSGTRYAHGGRRIGGSLIGGLLSRFACHLIHKFGPSAFTDATTGIKMMRREAFVRMTPFESRPVGWAVSFEMALKAQLLDLKLGEVPIISVDRLFGGQSTFQLGPWFFEYLHWFMWGVMCLRRHPERAKRIAVKTFSPVRE